MAATNATMQVTMTSYKPDGSVWGTSTVSNNSVTDYPIPTTGTYTLVLDPSASTTGVMTLTLSTEVGGTITTDGSPVAVSLTRAGQKARLTYAGTASQTVSLVVSGVTASVNVNAALVKPDGSLLSGFPNWSQATLSSGSAFLGPFVLPTTDPAYAVTLVPGSAGTGGATFKLYNIPGDVGGTLTINGGAATATITIPGQNAVYTFTGTAGQVVTARADSNTIGCGTFGVRFPNGSQTTIGPCTASFSIANITLKV